MTFCKIENWEKIRNDWFNLHCNGQDTKKSRCILYSQAFQPGAIQVIKSPFTIKMQRNCKFGILPKKKYFRCNGTKTIFGVMGRRRNGTSKLWEVTLQVLQSRKFFYRNSLKLLDENNHCLICIFSLKGEYFWAKGVLIS